MPKSLPFVLKKTYENLEDYNKYRQGELFRFNAIK